MDRRAKVRMDNMPVLLQLLDRFNTVHRTVVVTRNSQEHINQWNDFLQDAHYRNTRYYRDKEVCPYRVWGMGPATPDAADYNIKHSGEESMS